MFAKISILIVVVGLNVLGAFAAPAMDYHDVTALRE